MTRYETSNRSRTSSRAKSDLGEYWMLAWLSLFCGSFAAFLGEPYSWE